MDEDALIRAVAKRASVAKTRTDWAERWVPELAPPASSQAVERAEKALGCRLHHLHRRLFQEVGNGGFGPGDGLLGLPGGRLDADGRSVLELRHALFADSAGEGVPTHVVPLCDWGGGTWSCIDESSGSVLMLDEAGLVDSGLSLHELMSEWASGVSLTARLFDFRESTEMNPFTHKPVKVRTRGRPLGRPYFL